MPRSPSWASLAGPPCAICPLLLLHAPFRRVRLALDTTRHRAAQASSNFPACFAAAESSLHAMPSPPGSLLEVATPWSKRRLRQLSADPIIRQTRWAPGSARGRRSLLIADPRLRMKSKLTSAASLVPAELDLVRLMPFTIPMTGAILASRRCLAPSWIHQIGSCLPEASGRNSSQPRLTT